MAVGTFTLYSSAVLGISTGTIDLDTSPLTMALLTSAYTPSDAHAVWADVSANQVATGAGYNGPVAMTTPKCTLASGTVTFSSDLVNWANATFTAKYAVIVSNASNLVGYVDLSSGGGSVSGQGGAFSVSGDPVNGWFTLQHTP